MEQAVRSFTSELSSNLAIMAGDYKKDRDSFIGIYVSVMYIFECPGTEVR